MNGTTVLTEAFFRALIYGALLGLAAALTDYQMHHLWESSIINGFQTFLGFVIVRAGIEGGLDANRARTGDIQPSDIGAQEVKRTITGTGTGG